jgi:hypothetical protein
LLIHRQLYYISILPNSINYHEGHEDHEDHEDKIDIQNTILYCKLNTITNFSELRVLPALHGKNFLSLMNGTARGHRSSEEQEL